MWGEVGEGVAVREGVGGGSERGGVLACLAPTSQEEGGGVGRERGVGGGGEGGGRVGEGEREVRGC